jgi:hypothetical protein
MPVRPEKMHFFFFLKFLWNSERDVLFFYFSTWYYFRENRLKVIFVCFVYRLALWVLIHENCQKSTKSHHKQHDDYISLFFLVIMINTESEGFSKSEIFGLGLLWSPRTRMSEKLWMYPWPRIKKKIVLNGIRSTDRLIHSPMLYQLSCRSMLENLWNLAIYVYDGPNKINNYFKSFLNCYLGLL